MTQDQVVLLLDLRDSKERGAASMSCGQRLQIAQGLEKMKMIEQYGPYAGYRINDAGLNWLEKNRRRVK